VQCAFKQDYECMWAAFYLARKESFHLCCLSNVKGQMMPASMRAPGEPLVIQDDKRRSVFLDIQEVTDRTILVIDLCHQMKSL